MALSITAVPVTGVTRTATFDSLTIKQRDGVMSVDGMYLVELVDAGGNQLSLESSQFGFSQSELMASPGFASCYSTIRDLARQGIAQQFPELVIAT